MAAHDLESLKAVQAQISRLQDKSKAMAECIDEPDVSVYPLSVRNGAMHPDALCLLVWGGIAYAANTNYAVKLTDGTLVKIADFPQDVQNLMLEGIEALG